MRLIFSVRARAWRTSRAGDEPEDWAALTHQLRWAAPHYDHATASPWPLMVARKLAEYVMPVQVLEEIAEEDDTDAAPEGTS